MAQHKKTLYQILGVSREASPSDIGLAHEMRMSDLQSRQPPDPSAIALVQQAFEILSNPKRREAYDSQLVTASEKAAAEQQGGAPDLEIGDDEPPKKKLPIVPIVIVAAVVVVALFIALRPSPPPKAPEPVAAAKPAAPPPPRTRNANEVLADASTSSGQVMVYSMSGSATPIGVALAIEAGTMVTTCHGIPAGGKLVVKVGKEQHPADLTITDEALDLCRLSVGSFTTPPLKLAADEAKAGDKVFAIAIDDKGTLSTAEGTVKGIRKTAAGNMLELTTPVAANASGAGVFDQYGKLVGIATTPHDQGPGIHLAIPAGSIAQMRSRTK